MNGSQQSLEQACATIGLDAGGARLLRLDSVDVDQPLLADGYVVTF